MQIAKIDEKNGKSIILIKYSELIQTYNDLERPIWIFRNYIYQIINIAEKLQIDLKSSIFYHSFQNEFIKLIQSMHSFKNASMQFIKEISKILTPNPEIPLDTVGISDYLKNENIDRGGKEDVEASSI